VALQALGPHADQRFERFQVLLNLPVAWHGLRADRARYPSHVRARELVQAVRERSLQVAKP
jgi:hypothetical protein